MTKQRWRKLFVRVSLAVIAAIALFVIIFVAAVELTPFDSSKLTRTSQPTIVYDKNGSPYMTISQDGSQDLPYGGIPQNLSNAVVAIEDHNFWDSSSVDIKGLARAAFVDLWTKSYSQGASTIQMQLAKIVYLTDQKTMGRKFSQIVLGVQINRHFTKQEILSMYLNRVFLGENSVGVKAAAWRYFGADLSKNPNALTLDQAALLAGLPQAPTAYDPIKHPDAAKKRRNQVLDAMAKYGYITAAQAEAAKKKPINVQFHAYPGDAWDTHPLFANFLADYASKAGIDQAELLQGGVKIYTTIDPNVQDSVDKVFWSANYNNDFPGPTSGTVVQGAALFVDPSTGGVLGGAGSRKEGFAQYGLDRVYSPRPSGSSIKPVLEYGAAVETGKWGPDSILDNAPQNFGQGYTPRNDDPGAPAQMRMQDALATSQNVASVWLLKQIGVDTGRQFALKLGIPLDKDDTSLAIALGGLKNGVSTMDMASAYSAYANHGVQQDVHLISKVVNPQGQTIYQYQPSSKRVMSENTAAMMTQMMQQVVTRGTGTAAQVPGWDVAGKTGTAQYDPELNGQHQHWISTGWFDGYTPSMTGSIYIGYDQTTPQYHLTDTPYFSSYYAAKIFGDIAKLATAGQTPQHFDYGTVSTPQPQQTPVTGLQAAWDTTINALKLSWNSTMVGKVNFVIKRSDGAKGSPGGNSDSYPTIGQSNQMSYADTTVQPGLTYTYVVQAIDAVTGQPLQPAVSLTVTIQNSAPGDTTGNNAGGANNGVSGGTDGQGGNNILPGPGTGGDNSTGQTPPSPGGPGGTTNPGGPGGTGNATNPGRVGGRPGHPPGGNGPGSATGNTTGGI